MATTSPAADVYVAAEPSGSPIVVTVTTNALATVPLMLNGNLVDIPTGTVGTTVDVYVGENIFSVPETLDGEKFTSYAVTTTLLGVTKTKVTTTAAAMVDVPAPAASLVFSVAINYAP